MTSDAAMKPCATMSLPLRFFSVRIVALCVVMQWLGLALGHSAPATPRPVARIRNNPNIILIVVDGLSVGQLGCYGGRQIQTPNIDRMAGEGLRLTDYYLGGSTSSATKRSLLTGFRETGERIARAPLGQLVEKDWTLASMLRQAGYATAAFGAWELGAGSGSTPNQKGFEEWFGFLDTKEALEGYPSLLWRNQSQLLVERNANGKNEVFANDYFTTAAMNFIRQKQRQPFFCYLAYTAPRSGPTNLIEAAYQTLDWTPAQKLAASLISRTDRDVGKLLKTLKDLRIDGQTAIFLTSSAAASKRGDFDPAPLQGTNRFRGGAGDPWEGGLRAPMLIWWPGKVRSGSVSDTPCAAWDLVPTAIEVAGMTAADTMQGASWMRLFRGEPLKPRVLGWESIAPQWRAARWGEWKGIFGPGPEEVRLYRVTTDAGEETDRASAEPETVQRLRSVFLGPGR